jgi:hypothetical protein
MTITIEIPETEKQGSDLVGLLINKGLLPKSDAQVFASYLYDLNENKKFLKALTSYTIESDSSKYVKKCVLKGFIQNIVENGTFFSQKECEDAYVARIYYASGKKQTDMSMRLIARYAAKIAVGTIRGTLSRFKKSKLTTEFLKDYPSINPDALSYLHLKGKLKGTIEDFETLRNFLEIMIRDPKKKDS